MFRQGAKGISDIYFVVLVKKNKKRTKSEASVEAEGLVNLVHSYSGLRVFTNMFFKEIRFPLEADHFHPLKRVVNIVVSVAVKIK